MLAAEGIHVLDGRADQAQRITADELVSLVSNAGA